LLQDLGNLGQALAALVAVFGIPLAIHQLRIQNRIARVDVARDLETKWSVRASRVRDKPEPPEAILCQKSMDLVLRTYASQNAKPAFPPSGLPYEFPRSLMMIAPDVSDIMTRIGRNTIPAMGPRNEKEYETVLLRRCELMFPRT
jgi:hypothetical protein